MHLLQRTNIAVLEQLIELLRGLPLGYYHEPLEPLHEHSVGQHTRHLVEFYECLLEGYQQGRVNYDARQRNIRLETDKAYAIQTVENIVAQLSTIAPSATPLHLEQAFGSEHPVAFATSLDRELAYMVEHSIHHMAIIKIGLNQSHPEVPIPAHFGVAHSTIQYRHHQQTSA